MRVHNPHVPMDQRADVVALIDTARTALTNADADPELDAELAEFGYTTEKRDEGDALLDALVAASADMAREHGEAEEATDLAAQAYEKARKVYVRHVKLARIVFEDDAARAKALGLAGRRPDDRAALLDADETFYANALADADAVTALAGVNADTASLEAGRAALRAAEAARAAREKEAGEAEQSTVARDAAAAALETWFRRFRKVAVIATEDVPQLRERLGFLERS